MQLEIEVPPGLESSSHNYLGLLECDQHFLEQSEEVPPGSQMGVPLEPEKLPLDCRWECDNPWVGSCVDVLYNFIIWVQRDIWGLRCSVERNWNYIFKYSNLDDFHLIRRWISPLNRRVGIIEWYFIWESRTRDFGMLLLSFWGHKNFG